MKKRFLALLGIGVLANMVVIQAADSAFDGAAPAAAPESFQIRNKKFGDPLRPEDTNSATGARIVLYPAQLWKCGD
jgi:hypothetical protein